MLVGIFEFLLFILWLIFSWIFLIILGMIRFIEMMIDKIPGLEVMGLIEAVKILELFDIPMVL